MLLRPLKLPHFPHKYSPFSFSFSSFPLSFSLSASSATASSAASPPRHRSLAAAPFPPFSATRQQLFGLKHLNHREEEGESKRGIGFRERRFSCGGKGSNPMGVKPDTAASPLGENRDKLQNRPSSSSKLLTLPTILTIGRVAAVPFLVASFYVESWWGPPATTCIFIAAAITDWLDGYLARRMKLGTAFGAFLDPVADKLMVAATLVLLCTRPIEAGILGQAPWLIPIPAIAIIGREITMSAVREWAASQGSKLSEAVAVNNLGKWKTAAQMIALTILLGTRGVSIVGTEALITSGVLLLYFSAWLALWSLYVYMRKIWKVLLM